jgi:cytochrome c biogenesis protein CcdA
MDFVIQSLYYLLVWFVLGAGLTFILASAFFGYPKEKHKENQDVI